jgi:hypothetical protein
VGNAKERGRGFACGYYIGIVSLNGIGILNVGPHSLLESA